MLTEFYFEIPYSNFDNKLQPHFFIVTEHSTVTSQTQISVYSELESATAICSRHRL